MKKIIFFDGVCALCNQFVAWVLNRDAKNIFLFSSLQSHTAQNTLSPQDLSLDTLVYTENGTVFKKSKAVLRILFYLGGIWSILSLILSVIPEFIRDYIYDIVAKNRYNFFGKLKTCRLPNEHEKNFFLD